MDLKRNDKREQNAEKKQCKANRFMGITKAEKRNAKALKAGWVQNVVNPSPCVEPVYRKAYRNRNQREDNPPCYIAAFHKHIPAEKKGKYAEKKTEGMRKNGLGHFLAASRIFCGIGGRVFMKQKCEEYKVTESHFYTPFLRRSVARKFVSVKERGK